MSASRLSYRTSSTSVDLVFQNHVLLLSTYGYHSRSKLIRRFIQIAKDVVRIMNLQMPAENRMWFKCLDDRIVLHENQTARGASKLRDLVITIDDTDYFAPWIYDFYQRSSRVLIYKTPLDSSRISTERIYLVHRSYPNGDLQHPGGHLEYIEAGFQFDSSKGYYLTYETGIDYVRILILHLLQLLRMRSSHTDLVLEEEDITPSMRRWFVMGAGREVMEESGLDLIHDLSRLRLLKIGFKTFYLGLELSSDVFESGPQEEFAREVVDYDSISKRYDRKNTEFDRFWLKNSDSLTDHAWITGSEMVRFWEDAYKPHVRELLSKID